MSALLIFMLACVGVHRIWNFESIFTPLRTKMLRYRWMKAATCHSCNAFWVCAVLASLRAFAPSPAVDTFLLTSAAYAVVRGVLWLYHQTGFIEALLKRSALGPMTVPSSSAAPIAPLQKTAAPGPSDEDTNKVPVPCRTCGEKREAMIKKHAEVLNHDRRVVLMTSLSNFDPSYSLSTAVIDQARMLANNPTWLVQIWVHIGADVSKAPELPKNVEILPIIPAVIWRPDQLDAAVVSQLVSVLRAHLIRLGNATVITHDLLFQASYVTLAAAIHELAALPGFGWLHTCHSAAAVHRPVGGDAITVRTTLPYKHRLLCLNDADRPYLAAYYDTAVENVLVCPNARDFASFGNFDRYAAKVVRDYQLHLSDVTQIYPVSATRLEAKGVGKVIDIFGALVKRGISCKLVLATAHANGDKERNAIQAYRKRAVEVGLPADCLAITSELFPELGSAGMSSASIRDLFSVSNLFVFPTISEACSLVMAEAAISGCLLVANSSLHTTATYICPDKNLSFPFGSIRSPGDATSNERVAERIAAALQGDPVNCSRRAALRQFSYEYVSRILRDAVEKTPFIEPVSS